MEEDPHRLALSLERVPLEAELRRALKNDEFRLHYQPKVHLKTGQVCGVEALIRWQHPERGLIGPAQFLPAAEEMGLMLPIGDWVLHTACAQNRAWQDQGLASVQVAVNLSGTQVPEQNFGSQVQKILVATGLEPKYLQLELTEAMVMMVWNSFESLSELRQIGVQIALDNFGSGYSSLSSLRRLPVDTLQMDRAFVHGIPTDADDATIAKTIIALGHGLRLTVVAEGVETEGQLGLLREWGCDMVQGYLFSRPLPSIELAELLRDGRSLPETGSG